MQKREKKSAECHFSEKNNGYFRKKSLFVFMQHKPNYTVK